MPCCHEQLTLTRTIHNKRHSQPIYCFISTTNFAFLFFKYFYELCETFCESTTLSETWPNVTISVVFIYFLVYCQGPLRHQTSPTTSFLQVCHGNTKNNCWQLWQCGNVDFIISFSPVTLCLINHICMTLEKCSIIERAISVQARA